MTAVYGPIFNFLQLSPHLATLLGKAPSHCSLLFGVEPVRSLGSDETRKTVISTWATGSRTMKIASAITFGPRTLAQSTSTGLRLAPNTLPIGAVEPRSDVAFHNAQISTVYGVLLYPIMSGLARCGWLGPWAVGHKNFLNCWYQAIFSDLPHTSKSHFSKRIAYRLDSN